jgi:hypothetical protein
MEDAPPSLAETSWLAASLSCAGECGKLTSVPMKDSILPTSPVVACTATGQSLFWLLPLVGLLGWQVWQTLALFDASRDGRQLLNDAPLISGRHALHLYHGFLGAQTLLDQGRLTCFDPAFNAGYPKTPVFDPGSRPAELALALAGGKFSPCAYKITIAVLSIGVPVLLYLAGRLAGLCRGIAVLAVFLGQLAWWGQYGQESLRAGHVDLLLAALLLLVQCGGLLQYHKQPGLFPLVVVFLSGMFAWFCHPVLALLLVPAFLVYYFTAGPRHQLIWHAPLLGGLLAAIAANSFWLSDWVRYWWIRVPLVSERQWPNAGELLYSWWRTADVNQLLDRGLLVGIFGCAMIGLLILQRTGRRVAAWQLGLTTLGLLSLSLAGMTWEPLAQIGSDNLLVPALFFATVPASLTLAHLLLWMRQRPAWVVPTVAAVVLSGGVSVYLAFDKWPTEWLARLQQPTPLEIGLGEEREQLLLALQEQTSEIGRILWENQPQGIQQPRWTSLMPLLTKRLFVGGLDADIEHSCASLCDGTLAGRSLSEWTDAELDAYCQRYNIGWIVCWSAIGQQRFSRWPGALPGTKLPPLDGKQAQLFPLRRKPSFTLVGSARLISADSRGVMLADARPVPVNGESEGQVLLSLHYQAGMRVRPARVRLERAMDCQDPIPFVRLRLKEPAGRIYITWD